MDSTGSESDHRPDCLFTIDVEDWFHILDLPATPPLNKWSSLPSRIERNFMTLLDILNESNSTATCFFLGWIAEKFPHLVLEAKNRGHEIASHGYSHTLVYQMSERDFSDDIRKSRSILESISGNRVSGFRAAGFSAVEDIPWFFDRVAEAGYTYDSSVFPARHGHGGRPGADIHPHSIHTSHGTLSEYPISVLDVMGKPICFFGGGYLRLFPYWIVRKMSYRVLEEDRPVLFYVHPREIDPDQPRLSMKLTRQFKTYVNLRGFEAKVRKLTREFRMISIAEYLKAKSSSVLIPS